MRLKPRTAAAALAMFCCLLGVGCQSIPVTSNPAGAHIVIDGHDTGNRTPFKYSPRNFTAGYHTVTVEKDGYSTITPPQELRIRVSGKQIALSIIPPFCVPFFFKNLFHNHWKTAVDRLDTFQLREGSGLSRVTEAAPAKKEKDSIQARLQQLEQLKNSGQVSEEEYQQKRHALLDEL